MSTALFHDKGGLKCHCCMTVTQLDTLWQHLATFKCCLVAGLEPHSALPVALPMVFTDHCDLLPKGLRGIKILAHTAVSFLNFLLSSLEVGFFNNHLSHNDCHSPTRRHIIIMFYNATSICMAKRLWAAGQLLHYEHAL